MTLAHQSNALAERWDKARQELELSELFDPSDLQNLDSKQIGEWPPLLPLESLHLNHTSVVFLERLQSFPALPKVHIDFLGEIYGLSNTLNAGIRSRFYEVALLDPVSPAASVYAKRAAAWVVGKDVECGVVKGCMKFCRSIFRAVYAVDQELAISTYVDNKLSFHPITRNLIEKVSSLPMHLV